jgi:hypothetical protein
MKTGLKALGATALLALLASCGADGAPLTPTVSGNSTVGVNSSNGPFVENSMTIEVGL